MLISPTNLNFKSYDGQASCAKRALTVMVSWTACLPRVGGSGLGNFRLHFGVFLFVQPGPARTSKKMMPKTERPAASIHPVDHPTGIHPIHRAPALLRPALPRYPSARLPSRQPNAANRFANRLPAFSHVVRIVSPGRLVLRRWIFVSTSGNY